MTTLDAVFYDDSAVPTKWKALLPDWLVELGFKARDDLLDQKRAV